MKGGKNKQIIQHSSGEMVTIDEILKNDPKASADLFDLRKRMAEKPELFNFPERKQTQGQKKMKQLLEDVRRNTDFIKQIKSIVNANPAYSHDDLNELYTLYILYNKCLESFRERYLSKNKSYKLKRKLCREYGITPALFDSLVFSYKSNTLDGWDFDEETSADVCSIEIQESDRKVLDIHSFHVELVDAIEEDIYPVHLKIHRFASKRDTLDFIEKNWGDIDPYLDEKRIKQRKTSRQFVDFIWKNRDKKAKGIELLLKAKYPKENLVYFEINKILSEEKKRRKIK